MANKKEIELVLAAKFEASDSENSAAMMGQKIAAALERSFNDLGDKIGQKIVEGIQRQLPNIDTQRLLGRPVSQSTSTVPSATSRFHHPSGSSGLVDQFGNAFQNPDTGITPQPPPIAAPGQQPPQNTSDPQTDQRNTAARLFGRSTNRATGVTSLLTNNFKNLFGDPGDEQARHVSMDMARGADAIYSKFKAFETAKKFDKSTQMSDFGLTTQDLEQASGLMKDASKGSGPQIAKLIESIQRLTAATDRNREELSTLQKKRERGELEPADEKRLRVLEGMEQKLTAKTTQLADLEGATGLAGRQSSEMAAAAKEANRPFFTRASVLTGAATGLGMTAAGADFMAGRHASVMRGAAGTAQMNQFGMRDALSGDYGAMIATQMAGGEAHLRNTATSSQNFSIFSDAAQMVGSGLGSAAAFMSGGGAIFGGLLGANAVRSGSNLVQGITERDARIAQRMSEYKSLKMEEKSQELGAYAAARGNVTSAFRGAIGIGSDSYSQFLTGTGTFSDPTSKAMGRENAPSMSGQSVLMHGVNQGLSQEQVLNNLRSIQTSMGGAYDGQNFMDTYRMQQLVKLGNTYQSQGFYNQAEVMGGFAMGNTRFRGRDIEGREADAFEGGMSGMRLYSNIRGIEGMEEGAAAGVMGIAGREAASGVGASDWAESVTRLAMGQADKVGALSGPQATLLMNAQMQMQKDTMTGSGIGGIANIQSLNNLEKKLAAQGVTLDEDTRVRLQLNKFGAKDLENIAKKQGKTIEGAEDLVNQFNQDKTGNLRNLYKLQGAESILDTQYGGGTFEGTELVRDAATSGSGALKTDSAKQTLTSEGRKVPGKDEAIQDGVTEVTKVVEGMKLLAPVMETLKIETGKAADALKKLTERSAGEMAVRDEAEKEVAKLQDQKNSMMMFDAAMNPIGMAAKWAFGSYDVSEKERTSINDRLINAQAPGNKPGGK